MNDHFLTCNLLVEKKIIKRKVMRLAIFKLDFLGYIANAAYSTIARMNAPSL